MSLHEKYDFDNNNHIVSIKSDDSDIFFKSLNSDKSTVSSIKSDNYHNSHSSSDINLENADYFFTYNNNVIPVSLEELNMFENNCINIAILSNYYDKKDDSQFSPLYLPEISITYNSLIKLFFNCVGKNFTPYVLNKIWNSVRGLNLVNEFLKIFEKKTELSRNDLSVVSKIKLYKECSFSAITAKASKIFALNFEELNSTLTSAHYRNDRNIYISINFLLYSEILQIGINIKLPLLLTNVPESLHTGNNDVVLFNFDTSITCNS
jgi:hypothetical protein